MLIITPRNTKICPEKGNVPVALGQHIMSGQIAPIGIINADIVVIVVIAIAVHQNDGDAKLLQ